MITWRRKSGNGKQARKKRWLFYYVPFGDLSWLQVYLLLLLLGLVLLVWPGLAWLRNLVVFGGSPSAPAAASQRKLE